jgi:4-hydroxybenzoate polyprenyltransferase
MQKVVGFLRLMRLANIVTAISDILAGIAIAGYFKVGSQSWFQIQPVLLLILATVGLYGGGVVLNDVFDAELDKLERPERPIPSGLIPKKEAALLGIVLLLAGCFSASMVHAPVFFSSSSILAIIIAVAAIIYDKWTKHQTISGPLNMGICRGLNLLLGISIIPSAISIYWYLSIVPVIYIAAITMISRGEVHGGKKNTLYGAMVLYGIVIIRIFSVAAINHNLLLAFPFLLLFAWMIFPALLKAVKNPTGPAIGKAVKCAVIALILMNGAWAAAFGAIYIALIILLLFPVSLFLAKLFAVT